MINRILIENKPIHFRRRNIIRPGSIILCEIILKSLFFLFRKVIINNTFFQELGFHFIIVVRNQIILINSLFIIIGISRKPLLHVKEIISIPIDICLRCSREAYKYGIKIIKNSSILFENTSVTFINDNQVKVCWCKKPVSIIPFYVVNSIENSRIR